MKTRITLLILAAFISNFGYAQKVTNVQKVQYKHKPIVEMTLNNKKVWVLLDTGTDISILNIGSKNKYGFTTFVSASSKYKVPGFGSVNNQLHQVRNCELKFGNTLLKRKVYAFDISNITDSIKKRTGKTVTAIIGTNMMAAYGFVIDMGTKTVVMKSKEKNNNSLVAASSVNGNK